MKLTEINDIATEVIKAFKGTSMYFTIGNNRVSVYPEVNIIIINSGNDKPKAYRLTDTDEEEKSEPKEGEQQLLF